MYRASASLSLVNFIVALSTRMERSKPLPSTDEFDLACRERPAAKPATVDVLHHGIDLP